MDKQKLRFGFEYETLVERSPAYDHLMKDVKRWSREQKFSDICDGILNATDQLWDRAEILQELKQTTDEKQREFLKGFLKSDKKPKGLFQRFLLTSLYNTTSTPNTMFHTIGRLNQSACQPFPIQWNDDTPTLVIGDSASETSDKRIWTVVHDGSVQVKDDGKTPIYTSFRDFVQSRSSRKLPSHPLLENTEVVSPILTYEDLTGTYFRDVLDHALSAHGILKYWNNQTTSNHVHISYDDPLYQENKPVYLIKLCMAWWYFEPIFLLLMGAWRRDNWYCQAMREKMTKRTQEAFYTMNDTNFKNMEHIGHILEGIPNPDMQRWVDAIVLFFQGDICNRKSRYAAFNMLNLRSGGIQTVEVRIKQGSNDPEENNLYMLLLADFVHSVMTRPCVSNQYARDMQTKIWQVYEILKRTWSDQTIVHLSKHEKNIVDEVFREFLTYIPTEEVRSHIELLYDHICKRKTGTTFKPSGGSRPSKSPTMDVDDIEWTSFGPVDYRQLREAAKQDPDYLRMRDQWKAGFSRQRSIQMHPLPMFETNRLTSISVRGGRYKENNSSFK